MAPLTATLAAGAAVALAVALNRASRQRSQAAVADDERELGLKPGEGPAHGLKRMAIAQTDLALELLERDRGHGHGSSAPSEKTVHETRKALKRLRALLRLLRHELGADEFARENAALGKTAQRLSGARDAEVMLNTLDALIGRHPRKLRKRKGARKLRRKLLRRQQLIGERSMEGDLAIERVIAELRQFRAHVEGWDLRRRRDKELLAVGLRQLYKQGRTRGRRAARNGGENSSAMHDWRKRVKSLRYAAEMLQRPPAGHRRADRTNARLKRVAHRADELGEMLGEEHDLAVLAAWLNTKANAKASGRKTLLKLIARRRRKLRKQALRDGQRLYRRSPRKFVRRIS